MKYRNKFDTNQWAVIAGIVFCVVASVARLSEHQLWQDIFIIIGGGVIGLYGGLLATNWRGITERYSNPAPRLSPKIKRNPQRFLFVRIGGAFLVLEALIAIVSSVLWLTAWFSE